MSPARSTVIMWGVAVAALPSIAAMGYVYGNAVWLQLLLAIITATAVEIKCLYWQKKSIAAAADGSAAVAACILTVALPPHAPWFVIVTAVITAIVLAKHCYGGLGNNPFNPAMVGYVFALLSFPQYFDAWRINADAISSPTPLAAARLLQNAQNTDIADNELIALAAVIGGGLLLILRFADWRLPLAFLLAAAVVNMIIGADWQFLISGGLIFAAFFVITDPVTAAASRYGRWLYAGMVGALAMWLRHSGAHTDSIAFAVIFGNMLAPLCDLVTRKWRY